MRLLSTTLICTFLLAASAPARAAPRRGGEAHRTGSVLVEAVRGDKGTPDARSALRGALARHLKRLGFNVVESGKAATYRVQPTVLVLEIPGAGAAGNVEVKASVVAIDRKGRVAAMVEGGARTQSAPGVAPGHLESQAVEAAGRSIAEDLARRLRESR